MVGAKAALLPLFRTVLPNADLTNEVAMVNVVVEKANWED